MPARDTASRDNRLRDSEAGGESETTPSGAMSLQGFRDLERVAEAYQRLGFTTHREVLVRGVQIDLVLEQGIERTPVEVVGGAGVQVTTDDLRRTIVRLSTIRAEDIWAGKPIIVAAGQMSPATTNWAKHQKDVSIVRLVDLIVEARLYEPEPAISEDAAAAEAKATAAAVAALASERAYKRNKLRSELIDQLDRHDADATVLSPAQYEDLCMQVFAFVFDPSLFGFEKQARTSDGANRYDFICRIASGRPFWDTLRADFRTRAILFECKNYDEPVTADQIYSTERYLFTGALRTVCFLIARRGGTESCMRAAQGAMRESGKLILVLSNRDLVNLLESGEDQDSAENILDERIWRFIISLPR